ncbi:MAG: DNA-processing protein DprA [Muribaculaceae bacterium]|nr:DNA-processing protein DprA [Muribaculaceae bacterium]
MKDRDIIFKMAFSFLKKRVSADLLREFESRGVNAEEFFQLPTKELVQRLGISQNHEFDKMAREEALGMARKEYDLICSHNIEALFVLDEDYPTQLSEIDDPPILLYKLGDADLEGEHFVSVVGTRKPTPYGLEFCNRFIEETAGYFPDATIVSGLAFGVDAAAHKKALEKELPTIAVVAHGLNQIYPAANRPLAKAIVKSGGAILSEYPFNTQPFKGHFLARNRIVAGLSDVTVVVESNIKGGAMSTANYAFMYNREVMALPGRTTDPLSSGCNHLIRKNKAHLIGSVADMIEVTGWKPLNLPIDPGQRNLFPELEGDYKKIYEILKYESEPVQTDRLVHLTGIPASKLVSLLGELEFDGIIIRYPGNRFSVG